MTKRKQLRREPYIKKLSATLDPKSSPSNSFRTMPNQEKRQRTVLRVACSKPSKAMSVPDLPINHILEKHHSFPTSIKSF